jgi:nucleoside-diphosphate-sugar epimerase
MDTIADIGEAKRLLNWTPRFDLREGLADMLKNNGSI